jgi:murein DD-endopeptidase MepM/ murein hydrolase activator NlpD
LGLGTLRAAGSLLSGRAEVRWVAATGGTKSPSLLRFPVAKGWFVRGFGSGKGGYHQAMDIGGTIGWNVRAAAAGVVGYAGDEVSGYGNLVLLIHPGGFITSYAHNSKNRVVAGQRVERGEVIAELGSTGRSKGPHVHFELLYDGKNCDPGPLFRPDVRRKDGQRVPIPRAVWAQPNRRPKAIKCFPRKHHPDREPKLEHDESDDESSDTPLEARTPSVLP